MSDRDRPAYIELHRFLKLAGLAHSGGEAKQLVAAGEVRVNGELESRKRRKLRRGDRVALGEVELGVDELVDLSASDEAASAGT